VDPVAARLNVSSGGLAQLGLPLTVVVLVAYWAGVVVAMHLLQPQLDLVTVPMSVYVLGAHGEWMTTSFFAAAAIWLVLAFGLRRALPRTSWATAGAVLFCVAACGDVVMGLVPTQYPVIPPLTLDGAIHLVASLVAFNAFIFGSLSFARAFRGSARWSSVAAAATIVSLLMLAVLYAGLIFLARAGVNGLLQRALVVLILLWIAVVVRQWLRRDTGPAAHASDSAGA
jgi:Protein of unknown function (DUF998)